MTSDNYKTYYEKNKEKKINTVKKRYKENREEILKKQRDWWNHLSPEKKKEFSEKRRAYRRTSNYINKTKIKQREASKRYHNKIKYEVFLHYSNGKIRCNCCGEERIEFLTVDHVNNDGAEHRQSIRSNLYLWLKKNNYPEGFQILCWNCNEGKRMYGVCPHQIA